MQKSDFKTTDEYIKTFPQNVQGILEKVRQTIRSAAPNAQETINYQLPTFVLNEKLSPRNGIMFAAFKKHIGFYPRPDAIEAFSSEFLKIGLKFEKGSVQFPLSKPIPYALIRKIVKFRMKENLGK